MLEDLQFKHSEEVSKAEEVTNAFNVVGIVVCECTMDAYTITSFNPSCPTVVEGQPIEKTKLNALQYHRANKVSIN